MPAVARTHRITQLLQHLPRPVIDLLDAWSRNIARRHARKRQQAWLQRKAAAAAQSAAPRS